MKRKVSLLRTAIFAILIPLLLFTVSCSGNKKDSSTKPLIGISSGLSADLEGMLPQAGAYKGTNRVGNTYVEAVRQAGGIPVIIPNLRDSVLAREILSSLDGIILSGGEDVDPSRYGENVLEDGHVYVNSPRDTSDCLLAGLALEQRLPILAICRGMQLLNVILGGTLYQDLPQQVPSEIAHSQKVPSSIPTHEVIVEGDSFLSGILKKVSGSGPLMVNTSHHQAVKDLAPGLVIAGKAPDGVIEAYCPLPSSSLPYIIGVQFHPEALVSGGRKEYLPIFDAFLSECRKKR